MFGTSPSFTFSLTTVGRDQRLQRPPMINVSTDPPASSGPVHQWLIKPPLRVSFQRLFLNFCGVKRKRVLLGCTVRSRQCLLISSENKKQKVYCHFKTATEFHNLRLGKVS